MYVDETGGTEETVTTEEIEVTVDGQEYAAELNVDLDDDGQNDTALIRQEDGTSMAFVDSDGDGEADQYAELDAEGNVITEAVFDEASGNWVSGEPSAAQPDDAEAQTSTDGPMTAEMPEGRVEVGPATIDTDHDGVPDTAVAQDDQGNTYHFTDTDGDGDADVVVVTGSDGSTQTMEHQGGGNWTEVTPAAGEQLSGFGEGESTPATPEGWGDDSDQLEGVAKIDSMTGQWISQN